MKSTQPSRRNKRSISLGKQLRFVLEPNINKIIYIQLEDKNTPNWIAENMITIIDTPHVKHQTNNQETTSQIPLKQQKGGCYQTKQTSRKTQWRRNEK